MHHARLSVVPPVSRRVDARRADLRRRPRAPTRCCWPASTTPTCSSWQRLLGVRVSLRGRQLTLSGHAEQVERAAAVAQGMVDLARMGEAVRPRTTCARLAERGPGRPSRRGGEHKIVLPGLRRVIAPKTAGQRDYVQAIADTRHRGRHRPRGHRQDLSRRRRWRSTRSREAGQADHPGPARGRGRRIARLPARRHAGQGGSLPPPAVRRARGHDAARPGAEGAGDAGDRDRAAGLHARPHARRRLHHPGRGAERDRRRR